VGSLMLKYSGGGHKRAGTCQVPSDKADDIIKEISEELNARSSSNKDNQLL
jgi:nanoRNase/pAp phosphatase (c-di-AMP/oligoRNAs hydrolase)